VPPYVILHDRTLLEIARSGPRNRVQLAAIAGIGPAKLDRYGKEILAALQTVG
jgi:ATP-dependent DNA helicase RecQ